MCALSSTLRPATTNAILVTASSNFMPQYRSRLFQGTRNAVYLSRRIKRVKWWVRGMGNERDARVFASSFSLSSPREFDCSLVKIGRGWITRNSNTYTDWSLLRLTNFIWILSSVFGIYFFYNIKYTYM